MTAFVNEASAFIRFVWRRISGSQCQLAAAALTYTSLFALVPMMTVGYALLSLLPAQQNLSLHIEQLVFNNFLPDTAHQVEKYLTQFSQQAKALTVPGIAMLVVTSLMMLRTIENTFNAIWDVQQGRRGLSSLLLYWAILSLGPILAGSGLMLSTFLLSLKFLNHMQQAPVVQPLLHLLPFVLTLLALWLLYAAVPNCPVSSRHALIGAIVTAVSFECAKKLFAYVAIHSGYTLIYGAFAMVPLFLLWIYLCWMIVLCGAVLVRSLDIYQPGINLQGEKS